MCDALLTRRKAGLPLKLETQGAKKHPSLSFRLALHLVSRQGQQSRRVSGFDGKATARRAATQKLAALRREARTPRRDQSIGQHVVPAFGCSLLVGQPVRVVGGQTLFMRV